MFFLGNRILFDPRRRASAVQAHLGNQALPERLENRPCQGLELLYGHEQQRLDIERENGSLRGDVVFRLGTLLQGGGS